MMLEEVSERTHVLRDKPRSVEVLDFVVVPPLHWEQKQVQKQQNCKRK
jgi:hypothetical protein